MAACLQVSISFLQGGFVNELLFAPLLKMVLIAFPEVLFWLPLATEVR